MNKTVSILKKVSEFIEKTLFTLYNVPYNEVTLMESQTPAVVPPSFLYDIVCRLIDGYGRWYDFDRDPAECLKKLSEKINGQNAAAPDEDAANVGKLSPAPIISASLHEEQGAYLLTKKATMWKSHSHQFVYFFLLSEDAPLTGKIFAGIADTAIGLGRERVQPDANHIRTEVTCLIVADTADDTGLAALKNWSYRENFKLSLHGWLDGRAALITPRSIITGKGGRRLEDFLESLLYPDRYRDKNRGIRGWLRRIFR